MVADQIHYIEEYASVIEKCEKVSDDVSYMAFDGQGFFDYLGVKCYNRLYTRRTKLKCTAKDMEFQP